MKSFKIQVDLLDKTPEEFKLFLSGILRTKTKHLCQQNGIYYVCFCPKPNYLTKVVEYVSINEAREALGNHAFN